MMKNNNYIYMCPTCGLNLKKHEKQFMCDNNHNFDLSKNGYINLLMVNQKKTKNPGDNKEMVKSRSNFLDKGYYKQFSDKLNTIISENLCDEDLNILDSGCGDGYFVANLKEKLLKENRNKNIEFYGLDISKFAAAYASKRDKEINFIVGSNFNLPIMSNSLNCIIRNFAPGSNDEFYRTLKKSGKLIIITPGIDHLYGLKEKLYNIPRKHDEKEFAYEGLKLIFKDEIKYSIDIDNSEDINNLILMTPYYWSIKEDMREEVEKIQHLKTDLNFTVSIYEKL
ncbi:23S rRNA (guanine745-N1)-methyltransferase [Clostridium collagenovorans DSM 3089]|uniref:23S rRNA (Guanine745-N1)-methyltransferase n=1 Tax=Clostridium collagenovorans DSM 3089 TaxID=1121306 RepID=A0A1M5SET1_9CLOT|nr:methyltransferase domain-containing protein [Clostridium collagenovorans]SHH37036.1 23S rRNA (guanine745-N1)-methyltransferase [Clostridium collagenovorans DSM 3089]